ncbi:class A beta-lactamase-related serine hydrolase [Virgibacillus sp. C22-A2]|uniref:Class A beta-lactamase-related serine hydrolase n=1 Tax=Virgibacillus tibetensis TaxID=3042313 RepID=A0ABU6KG36_9BACI|nr:class A beta-lactamase-related serine hydrolase [Virgibacillus sp. C22-A2]
MNINQLECLIHQRIENVKDNFCISIHTDEGSIVSNASKKIRAASIVKLPILIETYRQIEKDLLSLERLVYVEKDMMVNGAGIINYLTNSHVYSYENLMELMIIISDNTAANILLDTVGMENVNKLNTLIGCKNTQLERKFMDVQAQESGLDNFISAEDTMLFLKLISNKNTIINDNSRSQIMKMMLNQQFKHKLPKKFILDDQIDIHHKTGELPGLEHDAAIIKYRGKTLHAAVLSSGWENNAIAQEYIADIGSLLVNYLKSG